MHKIYAHLFLLFILTNPIICNIINTQKVELFDVLFSSNWKGDWNNDEYAKQLKETQKEDALLVEISEMIKVGSFEKISDMLEYNLQINTAFAKKHFV